jgi:uncharacterized protein (UPF0332 family)
VTDENRKRNVAEALVRAREATRAAEALLAAGLFRDAVSRVYYAAYHYVRALLFARGLEARTHGGAFRMLHREFVAPGLLPNVPGWQLAGLQRSREMADYESAASFAAADVRAQLLLLESLAGDSLALLQREGLSS